VSLLLLLLLPQGLLLPLCASRSCTLREAVIFSSVLRRSSLPVLHSAAALLRLAQLEYCGTTSFFIRVLLDKKYALPYKVSGGLCFGLVNQKLISIWGVVS
jgi:essential nuclear protein 1